MAITATTKPNHILKEVTTKKTALYPKSNPPTAQRLCCEIYSLIVVQGRVLTVES